MNTDYSKIKAEKEIISEKLEEAENKLRITIDEHEEIIKTKEQEKEIISEKLEETEHNRIMLFCKVVKVKVKLTNAIDEYETRINCMNTDYSKIKAEKEIISEKLEETENKLRITIDENEEIIKTKEQELQDLKEAIEQERICPICYDNMKNACFTNCGHVFCNGCCNKYKSCCPICRGKSMNIIKLFLT